MASILCEEEDRVSAVVVVIRTEENKAGCIRGLAHNRPKICTIHTRKLKITQRANNE